MNAKIVTHIARAGILCLVFGLVACGGGGGGNGSNTASTPGTTNTPDITDTQPSVDVMKDDTLIAPPPAPDRTTAPSVVATVTPSSDPTTPPSTQITISNALIPAAGIGTKDPYFMAGGGYRGDVRNDANAVYLNGLTRIFHEGG